MAIATLVLLYIIYLLVPLQGERLNRDYSQVILASDSTFLRVFLNEQEQWCLPPSLYEGIPEKLKVSVLAFEDQYFEYHPGINPVSITRAVYDNLTSGQVVSGGSTITMQVARMIKDNPRTYVNKLLEMLLATKIEFHQSKEDILKDYLVHAPYGTNVRGYLAASYRYFGKKPNQLTWAEAALLAVLPNAPGMIFPTKNQKKLEEKRNYLLKKLLTNSVIDEDTYDLSLLEPIPDQIIPFPLAAPHLTERIHRSNQLDVVITTIDSDIQYETNFFVKQHASLMREQGIKNACALVVHNASGNVVAYVGSQDFHDLDAQGRVDGIQAIRSSGSILKPYLYALAIDEGLILPHTLIKDVPSYFGSFSPNNASETFLGAVPASQALVHSLNVPAVRLLNAFGVDKFYNLLELAGIQSLFRHPDDYGLPLILGGAEVSPWDVAKLYSGMANEGHFGEVHYLPHSGSDVKQQLVSPGASYLVLDELKELIRPGLEFYWKKYSSQRPIAWKTGTSYGHKDAWAAGSTPSWTIVVWVGNFDGESNKNLAGMTSAGPLLFNIAKVLPEKSKKWFVENEMDFVSVRQCKETGFYASTDCSEVELVNAPIGMKPMRVCPYHKKVFLDKSGEKSVCSHCWEPGYQSVSYLKFTPDINYYLRQSGSIVHSEPRHNPDCSKRQEHNILQIIYPVENANIFIPKDFSGSYEPLIGRYATQFPDREVFWYLDDSYLSSSIGKTTMPIEVRQGKHKLTVVDTEGNSDSVDFSVIMN